jgi:hypothetical protein
MKQLSVAQIELVSGGYDSISVAIDSDFAVNVLDHANGFQSVDVSGIGTGTLGISFHNAKIA